MRFLWYQEKKSGTWLMLGLAKPSLILIDLK
jgi:hypothetical protein